MTPEEQTGIADFLCKTVVLLADFAVLGGILDRHQSEKTIPTDWQEELEEHRGTFEYQAALPVVPSGPDSLFQTRLG